MDNSKLDNIVKLQDAKIRALMLTLQSKRRVCSSVLKQIIQKYHFSPFQSKWLHMKLLKRCDMLKAPFEEMTRLQNTFCVP